MSDHSHNHRNSRRNRNNHRLRPLSEQPEMPPHVFNFLTHDELTLCFAAGLVSKAEETEESYRISAYATPGNEGPTHDWTEITLRAIRFLSFEHGMKFVGINAHRDGRITAERPITPGNSIYVALMKSGGMPPWDLLLPRAVRIARLRVPSLDVEPMRAVAAMIEEEIESRIRNTPDEHLQAISALRREAVEYTRKFLETELADDTAGREERVEMSESDNINRPN